MRKKMIQVSGSTFISRILGMLREVVMARYFGEPGAISDAFFTAFKIPNSLRKMFAEGALSASFVPTFVTLEKEGKREETNGLMSLSFLIIEGGLLLLCLFMFWKAAWVIRIIVPGWYTPTETCHLTGIDCFDGVFGVFFGPAIAAPPVEYAITYLRILTSFILFLSSGALLACALQAVGHFFIPAFAPVLLNIVFIGALLICGYFGLPPTILCYFLIFGGFLQFFLHLVVYYRFNFGFGSINRAAWQNFRHVLQKFLPCFLSMSIMEIFFFVDTSLASFLSEGSVTLIYYANRFMGIPLGVFAVALSTVLLPYFASIGKQEPKKLSFYATEAAKLVLWVTLPATILMCFFSEKIFVTMFLSRKFTMAYAIASAEILRAFLYGLFFFSLNKILLNLYYALHETKVPLYVTVAAGIINFITSYYIFMPLYGAYGIAFATSLSGAIQTLLFAWLLWARFDVSIDSKEFMQFTFRYTLQVIAALCVFLLVYFAMQFGIAQLPGNVPHLLMDTILFWFWSIPLMGLMFLGLYVTRKQCAINTYFLE